MAITIAGLRALEKKIILSKTKPAGPSYRYRVVGDVLHIHDESRDVVHEIALPVRYEALSFPERIALALCMMSRPYHIQQKFWPSDFLRQLYAEPVIAKWMAMSAPERAAAHTKVSC